MRATKYPQIVVQLTGTDGNAFAIVGKVKRALREVGVPQEEVRKFMEDAYSGDYNHLLMVCMDWVTTK